MLQFGAAIAASDVVVSETNNGQDLTFQIAGTADRVTITHGVDTPANRIEHVNFADGTSWSFVDVMSRALVPAPGNDVLYASPDGNTLSGGAGDDTLNGSSGNDTLAGGPGNDLLQGGFGNDTYVFNRGDGQDTIYDGPYTWNDNGSNDVLQFGAAIAVSDIAVSATNNGQDLTFQIVGTADRVTITHGLDTPANRIEHVNFADGTSWSFADVMSHALISTPGNDVLYASPDGNTLGGGAGDDTLNGSGGNDTLIGGPGNDLLRGGFGGDTYVFNRGDGQDTIYDYNGQYTWNDGGSNDVLQFGAGIAASDVVVSESKNGQDLTFQIVGTADRITVTHGLDTPANRIEHVNFADGTSWSFADVMSRALVPTPGNDALYASPDGNTLSGGAGDDTLYGSSVNDTLIGGPGNDLLLGGSGDDTYVFNRGDGHDTIYDYNGQYTWYDGGSNDVLQFGAGIAASDIAVSATNNGQDLTFQIAGTADRVTITHGFDTAANRIEHVNFADGTSWSFADVQSRAFNGNDTLHGSNGNDSLTGGPGNDYLAGGAGDDTYIFNRGDGQDIIDEMVGGGNDVLRLHGYNPSDAILSRDGNDLILRFSGTTDELRLVNTLSPSGAGTQIGVEQIAFDDGTIWNRDQLNALAPAAVVDLTAVDLINNGGFENGVYTVTVGGHTNANVPVGWTPDAAFNLEPSYNQVENYRVSSGSSALQVGSLDSEPVPSLSQSFADVNGATYILSFNLSYGGGGDPNAFFQIVYDGGVVFSKNSVSSFNYTNFSVVLSGTGSDTLTIQANTNPSEWFVDDVSFVGPSADSAGVGSLQPATSGDDVIYGTPGADTLAGGLGNDSLFGGAGDDTYIFNAGDGHDTIIEGAASGNDTLIVHGYASTDAALSGFNSDLTLRFAGGADSILLKGSLSGQYQQGIEQIVFDDGVTWSAADIQGIVSSGDDTLNGSSGNDTLIGGRGNDLLLGGLGDDTYVFNRGDGQDTIYDYNTYTGWDGGSNDVLLVRRGHRDVGRRGQREQQWPGPDFPDRRHG